MHDARKSRAKPVLSKVSYIRHHPLLVPEVDRRPCSASIGNEPLDKVRLHVVLADIGRNHDRDALWNGRPWRDKKYALHVGTGLQGENR